MKILLVDDHALLRDALRGALNELCGDAAVYEAADSREAMAAVSQHADLDLVLLDLNLPDRNGFELLAELRARDPTISIVVVSALQDREIIVKALNFGAVGFIPKSAARKVILAALQLVFSGGVYIPPQALAGDELRAQLAVQASTDLMPKAGRNCARTGSALSPADFGLTGRQLDVLALMMRGKSNKAICRALNIAEPTVKNHVRAILKALRVTNRTEAVVAANELKWELPSNVGVTGC